MWGFGDTPARVTRAGERCTYRRRVPQIAAPVACVLAGLWLAYLVPYKLRHRQQLLESRADDRYSEALRVVAVTRRVRPAHGARDERVVRQVADRAHAGTTGLLTPGRGLAASAAGWTGGDTVDRPHATPERVTAEAARRAAQVRAARAAASARRVAAARRRAALAVVLVIVTAVCWGAVGLAPAVPLLVGIAPTVLLALVLFAGRHAVVAGARNDAAMAQQITESEQLAASPRSGPTRVVVPAVTAPSATVPTAAKTAAGAKKSTAKAARGSTAKAAATATTGPATATSATAAVRSAPTPRVTGRAVHPSEARTEVFTAIVADQGETGASARHATGQVPVVAATPGAATSDGWAPVPVPRPTYVTKPAAPHRDPVPLGEVDASTAVRQALPTGVSSADDQLVTPEPPAEVSASIDLNAVLAKRRAAGE